MALINASTLVRKYRDDIFFYLYARTVGNSCNLIDESAPSKHEKNIKKWQSNTLSNLNLSEILKYIATRPELCEAVKKYKLQDSFKEVGDTLNNYVHGNGSKYYNRDIGSYSEAEIKTIVNEMTNNINFITVSFVFLLILCNPLSIMSTDHIDYLDFGEKPPDGSQYWVAPFVEEYVHENINVLGSGIIDYLREVTNMEI